MRVYLGVVLETAHGAADPVSAALQELLHNVHGYVAGGACYQHDGSSHRSTDTWLGAGEAQYRYSRLRDRSGHDVRSTSDDAMRSARTRMNDSGDSYE